MPATTLIIGYGSDIRGDDALGPKAAELIECRIKDPSVRVLSRPSLTPELASDVSKADLVVFIDCAMDGPVGEVVRQEIEPQDDATVSMVHFLDPPALLYWAKLLYGRCPRGVQLTTAGCSFNVADKLSPQIELMVPKLVDEAVRIASEAHETCKKD